MTRAEEIDVQIELLQHQRKEARRQEVDDALRSAFQELTSDDALPAHEIIGKALDGWTSLRLHGNQPVNEEDVREFAERVTKLVRCHQRTKR